MTETPYTPASKNTQEFPQILEDEHDRKKIILGSKVLPSSEHPRKVHDRAMARQIGASGQCAFIGVADAREIPIDTAEAAANTIQSKLYEHIATAPTITTIDQAIQLLKEGIVQSATAVRTKKSELKNTFIDSDVSASIVFPENGAYTLAVASVGESSHFIYDPVSKLHTQLAMPNGKSISDVHDERDIIIFSRTVPTGSIIISMNKASSDAIRDIEATVFAKELQYSVNPTTGAFDAKTFCNRLAERTKGLLVNPDDIAISSMKLPHSEQPPALPRVIPNGWNRTHLVQERLKRSSKYVWPTNENIYGSYAGRAIIGRDAVIDKGVYLGGGEREAIVVDWDKYPKELDDLYKKILERANGFKVLKKVFNFKQENILKIIGEEVAAALGGNPGEAILTGKIDQIVKNSGTDAADKKIPINHFIQAKAGVCRHRAVLAGALIERLVREGQLIGSVSVDRCELPPGISKSVQTGGSHAWARFTESDPTGNKTVHIIDAALGYIGPLSEAGTDIWDYRRPEDITA